MGPWVPYQDTDSTAARLPCLSVDLIEVMVVVSASFVVNLLFRASSRLQNDAESTRISDGSREFG